MLHILRHAPSQSIFTRALDSVSPGDALLLIEDAVYALLPGTDSASALRSLAAQLYVLEQDLLARGLSADALPPESQGIDYLRMVELCVAEPKALSW